MFYFWTLELQGHTFAVFSHKVCGNSSEQGQEIHTEPRDFSGGPVVRLHTPNAGGPGSILGQVTRPHMLQPRVHILQQRLKLPHAAVKTQSSQISNFFLNTEFITDRRVTNLRNIYWSPTLCQALLWALGRWTKSLSKASHSSEKRPDK